MSLFIIILFVTSSALANEAKELRGFCTLPPFPENGYYVSSVDNGTPGDTANDYVLNVTCLPGYNLVGERENTCHNEWTSGPMPECLPYCNADDKNHVVTCYENTPRCLLNANSVRQPKSPGGEDSVCGEFGVIYSNVVSGGHTADVHELPWHAGIYRKTTTPYMQICGGSLISNNVILSAAHCFWNELENLQPASRFAVAVGKQYRPWNNDHDIHAQKSDVERIKVPVRYQGGRTNFQEDIAIVIVTTSFIYNDRVKPVCLSFDHQLDDKQLKDGNYGKVGGWGLTGEDAKASQVLKAVDLPYVDLQKCISGSPPNFIPYITSDKICAGYTNGTAVCKGDSGGGLVFPGIIGSKVTHFLRGIVSTAPSSNHACNVYAWGTFTHVINHERFIKKTLHVGISDVYTPPVNTMTDFDLRTALFHTANLFHHATRKPETMWI